MSSCMRHRSVELVIFMCSWGSEELRATFSAFLSSREASYAF